MDIPSNFWMVHRSEKFHSPSRRAVLSRSRSSFYRDADVDTHPANTNRIQSGNAATPTVGATGGHRDWRCADYRSGRKYLRFSARERFEVRDESEHALRGRLDYDLFLVRDLESLRVRGGRIENRFGAKRVPVPFQ